MLLSFIYLFDLFLGKCSSGVDVKACDTDEAYDSRRDSEDIQIPQSLELLTGSCILNIEEGLLVLVVGSTHFS